MGFCMLGKSWGRRDCSYKSLELLFKCKMAPENRSGGQKWKKKKQQHISWFPVFSVFLVNAASLFIFAQTWVKSQMVRHNDTHRPGQHQSRQEIQSKSHNVNIRKEHRDAQVRMELMQKVCFQDDNEETLKVIYCVWIKEAQWWY